MSFATPGSYDGMAPMETCLLLREQIAAYAAGLSTVPEFEVDCIALPGHASLLLIQANTKKYPISTDEDGETQSWIRSKRRYLHLQTTTSDSTQSVLIIK